ncbi:MAG: hypothetical protein ACO24P_00705 [Candidatus Nanopelagicaceae bacterium]
MNTGIKIQYGSHIVEFENFTDTQLPRSYMAQANLEFSQLGTAYATGPARKQRKMWSISAIIERDKIETLSNLYEAWDLKRSEGANLATVKLTDYLLNPGGSMFDVFITEPPNLTKLASGNNNYFIATMVMVET